MTKLIDTFSVNGTTSAVKIDPTITQIKKAISDDILIADAYDIKWHQDEPNWYIFNTSNHEYEVNSDDPEFLVLYEDGKIVAHLHSWDEIDLYVSSLIDKCEDEHDHSVNKDQIKQALCSSNNVSRLQLVSTPVRDGTNSIEVLLSYNKCAGKPSADDISKYLSDKYVGYQVNDLDMSKNGIISAILKSAQLNDISVINFKYHNKPVIAKLDVNGKALDITIDGVELINASDITSDDMLNIINMISRRWVKLQDEAFDKQSDDGNNPAGTAKNPIHNEKSPLYEEEIEGTGKISSQAKSGQQSDTPLPQGQSGQTEQAAPAKSNVNMAVPNQPVGIEESITLEDALENLTEDVEIVKQKIQEGTAILDGKEVESISDAPAPSGSPKSNIPAPSVPGATQIQAQKEPEWVQRYRNDEARALARQKLHKDEPSIMSPEDKNLIERHEQTVKQEQQDDKSELRRLIKYLKSQPSSALTSEERSTLQRAIKLEQDSKDVPDYPWNNVKYLNFVSPLSEDPIQHLSRMEDQYQQLDKLFYKRWYGSPDTGDAGKWYGYERISPTIYAKLLERGAPTRRGFYKTIEGPNGPEKVWTQSTSPKWDRLTADEINEAYTSMIIPYLSYMKNTAKAIYRQQQQQNYGKGTPSKMSDYVAPPKFEYKGSIAEHLISKMAVDDDAKEYWQEYLGDYGDKLVETVDNVLDTVEELGKDLTDSEVLDITAYLLNRPDVHGAFEYYAQVGGTPSMSQIIDMAMEASQTDRTIAKILDDITVRYLLQTSDRLHTMSLDEQRNILERAIRSNTHFYRKLYNLYNNMLGATTTDDIIVPNDLETVRQAMKITAAGFKDPKINSTHTDSVKYDKSILTLEDIEYDRDEQIQPSMIPMKYSNIEQKGVYTYMTVSWDPKVANKFSGQSLENAINHYIKNISGNKERIDFGFIGKIIIDDIDSNKGDAQIHFRTNKPGIALLDVITK
jgi:hypothetical protein